MRNNWFAVSLLDEVLVFPHFNEGFLDDKCIMSSCLAESGFPGGDRISELPQEGNICEILLRN